MSTLLGRRAAAASALLAAPGHETHPPELLARHAVDISNYTNGLTPERLDAWRALYDVDLVIVQSLDKARFPTSDTTVQLLLCRDAGMTCDLYVYPFFANGEEDCARRLSQALMTGVPIRRVWLDVEDVDPSQAAWTPAQRVDMVGRWLAACERYPARLPPGVYTGRWYWDNANYMGNSTAFSDRLLWDSNYDHIDVADYGFKPYGGWTRDKLAIKQYAGTSSLAGVTRVDLNVLSDAERAR